MDYESDSKEWYDYIQTLPFEEVQQLLKEKDSNESFESMKYQLSYKKKTGLCVSNLVKDADKNKENCTETYYVLDKTVEDALILSNGHDFNIYGEERIATELEGERLTYISSLNQSVMQNVKEDLKAEDFKQTLTAIEYEDSGLTVDIQSGFGYNGERLDETGNIYLRARYYNPRIGQFVQIDSYRGEQGNTITQQRYTYCANNQYKYTDPSGHVAGVLGGIIGGISGIASAVGGFLASITPVGWAIAGLVGIGVVGYGIYKVAKPKSNTKFIFTPPYVPPKPVPKPKVISKVIEVVSPTAATALKLTKAIVDVLPEPCPTPTHKDWNDVSDKLKNLARDLGMVGVLNYLLSKVDIVKKYRYQKNHHHIVLHKGQYGLEPYTMSAARENVKEVYYDNISDEHNMVWVHTAVHVHMHTLMYKSAIVLKFKRGLHKKENGHAVIASRLASVKSFLQQVDKLFFPGG